MNWVFTAQEQKKVNPVVRGSTPGRLRKSQIMGPKALVAESAGGELSSDASFPFAAYIAFWVLAPLCTKVQG